MRVRIKICGITSVADAQAAAETGADAIGLMLWGPSKRFVANAQAAEIVRSLPPFISKVGVFVDATAGEIFRAIEEIGLDTIQLHGAEVPEFCRQFKAVKVMKAFRVKDASSLTTLTDYDTDAWLLDSYVAGQQGGTGAVFNWDLAVQAKDSGKPIVLAGGLTPENIAEAVHEVWPYAVDVSSGVELAPGKKDVELMRRFIEAIHGIED
ncbi:MAG: trpF [Verrucomicrobia bacterium]|jgi:phosphoribosylanthranilate isomerase|nr:trpF [Verrucomicrobiota bacterium]